jgi:hypothetical protein
MDTHDGRLGRRRGQWLARQARKIDRKYDKALAQAADTLSRLEKDPDRLRALLERRPELQEQLAALRRETAERADRADRAHADRWRPPARRPSVRVVSRRRESHGLRAGHKRVTVRSSAKSGDSGDDPPGSSSASARCAACGGFLLWHGGTLACAKRRCSRYGRGASC